ncbi:MAG: hypothetical protein LBS30_01610 [Planctomycetota bacterium]|jgi:hypothetical protein|nr:hypothetical protein [Planctomycetota bacterium]
MTAGETTTSQRLIRQQHAARKKRYAQAVALIVLAVLAGVVIGVGGTVLHFRNTMHRIPPRPKAIGDAMIGHMRGLIATTPEEERRVREVIDSHLEEVDAMRRESFRAIREVFGRMDAPLESILGPDRMKIWREDRERRFSRKHRDMRDMDRRPRGHGRQDRDDR